MEPLELVWIVIVGYIGLSAVYWLINAVVSAIRIFRK
jgi:hypothetical protein